MYTSINNGLNAKDRMAEIVVEAREDRSPGNAPNVYRVNGFFHEDSQYELVIPFQNGDPSKVGINGIAMENLLAISKDRLEGFQQGPYKSGFNALALANIRRALRSLNARQSFYSYWPTYIANLTEEQHDRISAHLYAEVELLDLALKLELACEQYRQLTDIAFSSQYTGEHFARETIGGIIERSFQLLEGSSSLDMSIDRKVDHRPNAIELVASITIQLETKTSNKVVFSAIPEDFTRTLFNTLLS